MNIQLDGGKYQILADQNDGFKNFRATRHGEKWRDLAAEDDNLIYWLCQEIEALKKRE